MMISNSKRTVCILPAVRVGVLLASLIAPALAQDLRPRFPVEKPAHTVLDAKWNRDVITVKFQDGLLIRLRNGALTDFGTGALTPAASVLRTFAGGTWQRAHDIDEEELDRLHATAEHNLGILVADLNLQYLLRLPASIDAATAIDALNALDCVELAQGVPLPAPSPVVPNFTGFQGYLSLPPAGTGSTSVSSLPGGTGSGVRLADIEYSWNFQHTDFPAITLVGPAPVDPFNDTNHGTATMGEILARNDASGTTGAAYGVTPYVSAANTSFGYNVGAAITRALSVLHAGDVMLIEAQIFGPNTNPCCSLGGCAPGTDCEIGYVPVEWFQPTYNAIVTAVGNGVTVVEAAGNGSQNLDAPVYGTGNGGHWPFLPTHDSGAIIVGAGAAPASFGGSTVDRSRLGYSDYGSTVDLQGWGELVTTLGYGDLYSAGGANFFYTRYFSGTSSASPIVASACIQVQSIMKALTGSPLTPAQLATVLRNTGSPQQSGAHPSSQHIGPRPDVHAAIASAYPCFDASITGPSELVLSNCGSTQGAFSIATAGGSPSGGSWVVSQPTTSGWNVHLQQPATGPATTLFLDATDATAGSFTAVLEWNGTCSGQPVHFEKSVVLQLDTSCAGPSSLTLVSRDATGSAGGAVSVDPTISSDGGRVLFASQATNLVQPDANAATSDVYLYESVSNAVGRLSVDSNGAQDTSHSCITPSLSADGRFAAFTSSSPVLVPNDTNFQDDIFVRDVIAGTTTRVSIADGVAGQQADGPSETPSISGDGNFVAFASSAGNLANPALVPFQYHVHVRDRSSNVTTRIDVGLGGALADADTYDPVISADGRFVAYRSVASNLTGVVSSFFQIYVTDRQTLTTELVSKDASGAPASGDCGDISISADGRFVAFSSTAANLVAGDGNGNGSDVYVRDRLLSLTTVESISTGGSWGNAGSSQSSISSDGHHVAFRSAATNLVAGDTNGRDDIFVRDRQSGQTVRASLNASGAQADASSGQPSLSDNGRFVAFCTTSSNFPGGGNGQQQVYVRDLGLPAVTIYCHGDGNGSFCPCNNNGTFNHGCANSVFTAGATLRALGGASRSADTFVLEAGSMPNSSVLFFQGTTQTAGGFGVWFGDGLRCAGGSIVRLGVRLAASNTAQYPGASGIPVSIKGAIPAAGGVRTYQAWYRNVAGPCASGFNLTNGLLVTWLP